MTNTDAVTAYVHPPDLEPVPTAQELVRRGLAREVVHTIRDLAKWKTRSEKRVEISPEGQQLIYDAMKRNAERGRAWDAQRRMNAAVDAGLV